MNLRALGAVASSTTVLGVVNVMLDVTLGGSAAEPVPGAVLAELERLVAQAKALSEQPSPSLDTTPPREVLAELHAQLRGALQLTDRARRVARQVGASVTGGDPKAREVRASMERSEAFFAELIEHQRTLLNQAEYEVDSIDAAALAKEPGDSISWDAAERTLGLR